MTRVFDQGVAPIKRRFNGLCHGCNTTLDFGEEQAEAVHTFAGVHAHRGTEADYRCLCGTMVRCQQAQ